MGGYYGATSSDKLPANLGTFAEVFKNSTDGQSGYFADPSTSFSVYAGASSQNPTNGPVNQLMYPISSMNYYYKGKKMNVYPNSYYSLVLASRDDSPMNTDIPANTTYMALKTSNWWHNIFKKNYQSTYLYVRNLSGVSRNISIYDTTDSSKKSILVSFAQNSASAPSSMTNITKHSTSVQGNDTADIGYSRNATDNPGFPKTLHYCVLYDEFSGQKFMYTVQEANYGGDSIFSFGSLGPEESGNLHTV